MASRLHHRLVSVLSILLLFVLSTAPLDAQTTPSSVQRAWDGHPDSLVLLERALQSTDVTQQKRRRGDLKLLHPILTRRL